MPTSEDTSELIARLNGETAKIEWQQLQKHYASGSVIAVAAGFDLIKVAIALHQDDTAQIKQWLAEELVTEVTDSQAQRWYDQNTAVWALVIPPFVLVQETKSS
ncbi:MAG: DUF2288 domain-containing protein [Porticoccaceae bacterium]|nr:DUF2288 domain-containing protein [Porticoccaceae bacterium]